jgi:hypothetical protein
MVMRVRKSVTVDNGAPRVTDVFPAAGASGIYTAARKAKLNPNRRLPPSTTYKAVVNTGAKDLAGHPFCAQKVWYFTTRR